MKKLIGLACLALSVASVANAGELLRPSERTGFWDFTIQTRILVITRAK